MRGNVIVLSAEPNGRFVEGTIKTGITPKPGTIMQIDVSAGLDSNNRPTWEYYEPGTDGHRPIGPYIVLREDIARGKTATTAYAAGDHAFGYIPLPGDELNLLLQDTAGTADISPGQFIVDNGTGEMIATTGTVENEPFLLMETISAPTADTLGWGFWSGT